MNAPDKAAEIKAIITAAITFFTALWGWLGWAIFVFIATMFLDYLTGTLAARAANEWSSDVARQGLWHKLGEILALLVAVLCDIAIKVILNTAAAPLLGPFEYNYYFTLIVAIWYIFTEVGSIIENAAKMGAKIPPWLGKGIALLKGRVDEAAPIGKHEKQE